MARKKGTVLDMTHSLAGNVENGVTKDELVKVAQRKEIIDIQEEMMRTFEKREQPGHGFDVDIGVINSAYDSGLRAMVQETIDDIAKAGISVTDVVLAGIGGSELGATAAIAACGRRDIRYHPITSLNNDNISNILRTIEPEGTVLIEVSRSGTTKETLTSYSVVKQYLSSVLGQEHMAHCVAVLGKDKQDVAKAAAGHYKIGIEGAMSGRYTGLHAANLFTMALMGVDTEAIHAGARDMLERCMKANSIDENPALQIAALKYVMNTEKEKYVWNTGVFSPSLVKYGDWLDQITEESLGHNTSVRIATKTTELSNKLHSDFQNWWAGDNIFYHQIVFPVGSNSLAIGNPNKRGESLEDIELAAYIGTVEALAANGRPSFTTFMDSVNAYTVGELMMRDMLSTIYLGELLGLGTEPGIQGKGYFNQPGVQHYKAIMSDLLAHPEKLKARYESIMDHFQVGQ